ncbi:MAG: hypothetical protein N3B68_10005, partial [Anaerolineae bacterium]|nr:hypothetical protein [Anaerolineae bacterium]
MPKHFRPFLLLPLLAGFLLIGSVGTLHSAPAGSTPPFATLPPALCDPATCDLRPCDLRYATCALVDPALARVLAQAGPDDVIPAIVVLREQVVLTPPPTPSPLPVSYTHL